MHIGFVHSTPFPSVEADTVQVVQMCRAFASLGHQVTLFIPRARGFASDESARKAIPEIFGAELPIEIVFVPQFTLFGRFQVLGSVRGTLKALRKHTLDVIFTRNPWSVLFLPRAGVPYVFEAHEEHVHDRSRVLGKFLQRTIVRNSRRPSCALVVTISEALRKIWEGYGVPREKLLAAHDGVELELFDKSLDKAEARRELREADPSIGFKNVSRPAVVYTGAMKSDRGIDMMLASASALPDMDFYFIGGSEAELTYWRNIVNQKSLLNAHFPGRVPHRMIPVWLAAADILLMNWTWKVPTIRGCSPMKMFEYMAAKRLIIGPAFPTVCEVLENGKDALLFEPDSVEAMVQALRRGAATFDDPSLPQAAYVKVSRDYTWGARCQRILSALPKSS